LKVLPRFSLEQLRSTRPNKLLIETLHKTQPVVIEGIKEIAELRNTLKDHCLKIAALNLPQYGFEVGIMKSDESIFTNANPIMDTVPRHPDMDPEKFPESFKLRPWPQVPGYKETTKEVFKHYRECAIEMSAHLDAYMKALKLDSDLEKVTKESPLGISRSFVYNEKKAEDIEGALTLKWHYDRTLYGGCIKDFYMIGNRVVDNPDYNSFTYNDAAGTFIRPLLNDDDILMHLGMSTHILTAGHFNAHSHSVTIPKVPGLKRISNAYFIQPSPDVILNPPAPYEMPTLHPHDVGLMDERIGYKLNWSKDMNAAEWSERLFHQYWAVFKYKHKVADQ